MQKIRLLGVPAAAGSLAALLLVASAHAKDTDEIEPKLQGWALVLENDFFGRGRISTDRWYTNGIHFARSFDPESPVPRRFNLVRDIGSRYFGVTTGEDFPPTAVDFGGQNIYTPNDIDPTTPQIYDRPYAAMLFYGAGSFAYNGYHYRSLDLRIGVVGPAAGGKQVQSEFHNVINDGPPNGWAYQVRPRLALQGTFTHTQRFYDHLPPWLAVHVHGRATVGTIKNLAATGVSLVAGEKTRVLGAPDEGDFLAVDFNNRRNYFSRDLPWLNRWTFYLQFQMAAVASNYLIEGRTYGPRPEIELKHGVWMSTLGFSVRISDPWRIEYRIKRRSAEFAAAVPYGRNGQIQNYGEFRVIYDFDTQPTGPVEKKREAFF